MDLSKAMHPDGEKIGFFMGSFDPIHNGHVAVIRRVLEEGMLDRIMVVPCPQNPWKNFKPVNLGLRYWMCKGAVHGLPKVSVETGTNWLWDEAPLLEHGKISFSYLQLQAILKKDKLWLEGKELYILCGTDVAESIPQWKNSDWILENFNVMVIDRPGYSDKAGDWAEEISSTMIREMISKGMDVSGYIPEKVYEIIKTNHLYEI